MKKFSLVLKQEEIEIEDTEGTAKRFTLKEMNGQGRDAYMDLVKDKTLVEDGKVVGFKSYAGIHSALLANCLHDENDDLVPENDIQQFPTSVVSGLFEIAQVLNDLSPEDETKVKNDSLESAGAGSS